MFANFTEETCTGTGDALALAGATAGNISFSNSFADNGIVAYVLEDSAGTIKVAGVGTYKAATNEIIRSDTWLWDGTIIDNAPISNVVLGGGTHTIRCDITSREILNTPMKRRNGSRVISASIPTSDAVSAGTLTADIHYTIPFLLVEPMAATKIGIYIDTGVDLSTSRLGFSRMGLDSLAIDMLVDVSVATTTLENATGQEGSFTEINLIAGWYNAHFVSTDAIRVGNTDVGRNPTSYPLQNMNAVNRLFPACYQTAAAATSGAFNAPETQTTVSTAYSSLPIIWLGI